MLKKILVVSPHPDDETLGAGGTILRYKKEGFKTYWLNITDVKKEFGFSSDVIRKRGLETRKVAERYGFEDFFDLRFKPAGIDRYPIRHVIEKISAVFSRVRPEEVILPFRNDAHSDHRIVFEASCACAKTFRHPYVKKILMMEITSETDFSSGGDEFAPNYFVDISDFIEEKLRIMKIYGSEIGRHPFPRNEKNVRALAVRRGSQANCEYAESFMLVKNVY